MTSFGGLLRTSPAIVAACALAALGGSSGHAASGIRGYYDPATRTFTPLAPPLPQAQPAKLTALAGTFKITVSVRIDPQIPTDVQVYASVTITAQDPPTYNPALNYTFTIGGNLTRSGNTGTITLSYPYAWEVADPSAPVTFQVQLSEGNGPQTRFQPYNQFTKAVPMPANGATTPVTLGGTI